MTTVKKESLNEVLRIRINKIITEELGINDALDNEATRAAKSIIKNLSGKPFREYRRENGETVYIKSHTENVEIYNKKVKIYVTNYLFKTEEEKINFLNKHIIPQGYVYETNMLCVPVYTIEGKGFEMREFIDTIYHELEHFMQTNLIGHDFGSEELYMIAKTNLYSSNETERALAQIIYASSPSEQDAFINGMYGSLKNSSFLEIDDEIKKSEAYAWYKNLCKSYLLIKNSDIKENVFKKSRAWFISIAKRGIKRYEKKLARTIYKLKKDTQIREGYHPYFSTKHPLQPGQLFWLD